MQHWTIAALVCALATVVNGAQQYSAPVNGIDAAGQNYQLGIWSAILFIGIAVYGFYALASLDYSGDTLFYVDTEAERRGVN